MRRVRLVLSCCRFGPPFNWDQAMRNVNSELDIQRESGRKGGKSRWRGISRDERRTAMSRVAHARWGTAKKSRPKNQNASQLASLRWQKLTPAERKEAMRRVGEGGKPSPCFTSRTLF